MGIGSVAELAGGNLFGGTDDVRAGLRKEAAARGSGPAKKAAKDADAAAEPEARRKVTPMLPTMFDEGGSAFERAALNVANLDESGTPGETTLGSMLGWMKERWGTGKEVENPVIR